MNQKGLKVNSSAFIDQLTYTYQLGSNKLQQVTDAANGTGESKLGDFKYNPATKTSTDYSYDVNGNMNQDNNKSISSITYNHLNLPQVITVTGKGTITYTYDAAGNKLRKVTVDNTATPTKTTVTDYIGGLVYENDVLQFIPQEEGRIRFKPATGATVASLQYDYMLKDHLGNVRMVLTEEQQQDKYPLASLEPTKIATEKTFYDIKDAQVVDKTMATGISTYVNDNGIGNNPADAAFAATSSTKLYKLNSNEAKTGLGITLKVMAGDKLDVFGKSYYFQNTNGTGSNSPVQIADLLTSFLNAPNAATTTGIHGGVSVSDINTPAGITGINSMVSQQNNQSNAAPNKPRAFINVIFFDEQFKAVDYRVSMVGTGSTVKDHYSELQNLVANKSGFVYIYCSNESPVNVFFDNIQVVHTRSAILEETHYYPFGLTMVGISSKAAGTIQNKDKTFQGQKFDDDLGINLLQFKWRNHDVQIGRFCEIDPLSEKYVYNSTYAFSENKVTSHVELEGLEAAPTPDKNQASSANNIVNIATKGLFFGLNGKYQIEPARGATVTGIRNTDVGRINKTTGKPVGEWEIRVDNPHAGAPTPHLNVNPKTTGIPDPHTPLTTGQFKTLQKAGQILDGIDKVAKPVAIVTDAIQLGNAIKTDIQQGTGGDNTIITSSRVAGGWAGAWGGAQGGATVGAAIGSFFGPGPGTAVGGFIGGIIGGIGGAIFGSNVGEKAGEKIVEIKNK